MTWRRTATGFDLLDNRDELRSRPRAEAPAVRELDGGLRWIAPRDPEGGGSWIGVNEHGLALTLLNGDRDGPVPSVPTSRGLLVAELATSASVEELRLKVLERDLGAWRAFALLALDPAGGSWSAAWEAGRLEQDGAPEPPLASSSFRPTVRGARERLWREMVEAPDDLDRLLEYHRSHRPEKGAHSPCMHRPEARTVSFSWITVDRNEAVFRYADGAPCVTPAVEAARLRLRS